jgi:hypothetical protein
MEIRDFAANRSFSGNGLWQWYEKPGLARHAGGDHGSPLCLACGKSDLGWPLSSDLVCKGISTRGKHEAVSLR